MVILKNHKPWNHLTSLKVEVLKTKRGHLCFSLWLSDYWNNGPQRIKISPGIPCWGLGSGGVGGSPHSSQRRNLFPRKRLNTVLVVIRPSCWVDRSGNERWMRPLLNQSCLIMGLLLNQNCLIMDAPWPLSKHKLYVRWIWGLLDTLNFSSSQCGHIGSISSLCFLILLVL